MHEFEIHLKSGQTLTWQCKEKKRAKGIRKDLERILLHSGNWSLDEAVFLGRKKNEKRVVFLEKDVAAFSYKNVEPLKVHSFVGGTVNAIHVEKIPAVIASIADSVKAIEEKRQGKNEEETD